MQLRISLILLVLFCSIQTFSQSKFTISGYVKDASTGEDLIGATVIIKELPGVGASTNTYGFYSMTIAEGEYTLVANFLGLEAKTQAISLHENISINFNLEEGSTKLKEVVISSEREDENLRTPEMGIEKIEMNELNDIPVLMGEKDVLKTIQLKPGVKAAGEGSSGFFVRGGKADQNLILLDEATVYNASHLLGFFSVFNAEALKDIKLYKGTQPAEYGGRLSSVMDIHMKDGNNQKFGVSGGIGLISSRLAVEGPIVKNKGSFHISGRRTYADFFLRATEDFSDATMYFYDVNAKANYQLGQKDRIYFSGYFGRDVFGMDDLMGFDWGNTTATLRWNHLFSNKLFSNTSLIFSNYNYNIEMEIRDIDGQIVSRIQDYNLKQDFQLYANEKHTLKFGLNSIYHTIVPGEITLRSSEVEDLTNSYAWENAVYISHTYKPITQLTFEYGLRLSSFSNIGTATFYDYNAQGTITDTTNYSSGEFANNYFVLEPRFAVNYQINDISSVKFGYGRNAQYIHLLSNNTSGNPTDMWIPSTPNVEPEISDQVSLGYFRNLSNNKYEVSIETYYKALQNQIDYRDGAELQFNNNVESELLYGDGRAYGVELMINKKKGRLHGWISYTLSRAENQIEGINNGDYYPSNQNRTHDVSIVGMYDLTEKWTLSASWVYYTGNAVTFPSGKYEVAGEVVNYYTERNGYNMPDYHRLDLGATWNVKKTEKFESSWNFSLYNAYGRENAYTITFQEDPDDPTRTQALQTSLFRWVPSVTYNFKF